MRSRCDPGGVRAPRAGVNRPPILIIVIEYTTRLQSAMSCWRCLACRTRWFDLSPPCARLADCPHNDCLLFVIQLRHLEQGRPPRTLAPRRSCLRARATCGRVSPQRVFLADCLESAAICFVALACATFIDKSCPRGHARKVRLRDSRPPSERLEYCAHDHRRPFIAFLRKLHMRRTALPPDP